MSLGLTQSAMMRRAVTSVKAAGCRNRAHLVAVAVANGWVDLTDLNRSVTDVCDQFDAEQEIRYEVWDPAVPDADNAAAALSGQLIADDAATTGLLDDGLVSACITDHIAL